MIAMITATASAMIPMSIQIIDVEPIMDATPSATSPDVLAVLSLNAKKIPHITNTLYKYLFDNRNALKPYQSYENRIPEPPDGIIYKNMGVQENQNCTLITMRMKHRRMRWSENGANNMAKVLYRKENRELGETIDRYMDGLIFLEHTSKVLDVLSAGRAPKRDGKGNPYVDVINHKMPILEAMQTASRRAFRRAFG